jgi:hypothetical protein
LLYSFRRRWEVDAGVDAKLHFKCRLILAANRDSSSAAAGSE